MHFADLCPSVLWTSYFGRDANRDHGDTMKDGRTTVAYVIDSLSFGGAEKQLALLVRALPPPFSPVVISLTEINLWYSGLPMETEKRQRAGLQLVRFSTAHQAIPSPPCRFPGVQDELPPHLGPLGR